MRVEQVRRSIGFFKFWARVSGNIPLGEGADLHIHKEIEIVRVIKGKMMFNISNTKVLCNPGDIIIINNNLPHSVQALENNTVQMMFQSDISLFYLNTLEQFSHPYLYNFLSLSSSPYYYLADGSPVNKEISEILTHLCKEVKNQYNNYDMYIKGYLTLLSACLNRNKILTDELKFLNTSSLEKIAPIIEYIDEKYAESLSLTDISKTIHTNEYYLCRIFKAITGQTVFNYINHVRISAAEKLLSKTNMSVFDIAEQVGFSNIKRFDEAFKRTTSITPLQYRRLVVIDTES